MGTNKDLCVDQKPLSIEMPTDGTQISFNTWHKETRPPFVIYADLEAFDVRTDKFKEMQTRYDSGLNSKSAETMIIEHQYPCIRHDFGGRTIIKHSQMSLLLGQRRHW